MFDKSQLRRVQLLYRLINAGIFRDIPLDVATDPRVLYRYVACFISKSNTCVAFVAYL